MQTFIRPDRDLRIDFFRGVALWCMFIDHLILGWLRAITIMRYGFSDSAELFVFLSGVSAGMVYGKLAERKGMPASRLRIFQRVVVLYRTQLIMLVVFLAEAALLMKFLRPPGFLEFNGLENFSAQPVKSLFKAVILLFQPRCMNILPLYIVFLSLLCATLPLVLRRPRLVLGASCALYVATQLFHLQLPFWPGFFNLLAWQLVFVLGLVARRILTGKQLWRGWDVLAGLFVVFALVESQSAHLAHWIPAPIWLHMDIDRSNLHPLRLLSIASYGWLGWRYIPVTANWLRSRWAGPLVLLGQHSLPVFVVSVFLSMAGQAWFTLHRGVVSQVVIQVAGSLILLALAAWCAWRKPRPEARVRAAVTPEPDTVAAPSA